MSSAFWDSSAVTPLCIAEPTSSAVKMLGSQYEFVVWWATYVEIRSALARKYRAGVLDEINRQAAMGRLTVLRRVWDEIAPGDAIRELSAELMDKYPLRAADSMQLAAAVTWCSGKPRGRIFISSDIRLCEAATSAGFTVIEPASFIS